MSPLHLWEVDISRINTELMNGPKGCDNEDLDHAVIEVDHEMTDAGAYR